MIRKKQRRKSRPEVDFRIFARIEQIAPDQFVVLVSGLRDETDEYDGAILERYIAPDRENAITVRDLLIREVGQKITARGDRVVDVEEE